MNSLCENSYLYDLYFYYNFCYLSTVLVSELTAGDIWYLAVGATYIGFGSDSSKSTKCGNGSRIGNGSTKIPKHEWNSASLKMRRTKSNCFNSSAHRYPIKIWVENSCVPDLRLCALTDHVMSQRFSHATIQRQILGFFCIWHMPQNMAIQKHMSAQWTVMLAVRCFESLGQSELWVGFGTGNNKAIRDGKYLALPHSIAWQRSPHFCCDVISLLARVFIFLIDRATQEVPIQNIWKK